ncbi:sestrin 1 [Echinococcus multilocularis]|uniref:Sestrin 1 n=1 Tax=Echinococcus multilocularis TaxID=6211 RepID=A0A087VXB0_ECHMU|nr:sestrin 1 [Echinococcus multilocularis]
MVTFDSRRKHPRNCNCRRNTAMLRDLQRISLDFASRSVDSLSLLQGFSHREFTLRTEWAQSVQRVIDSWFFGFGSPAVAGFLESYSQDSNGTTVDTSMHHNILSLIPDFARVIQTCPLRDVRDFCQTIIEDLKKKKHFIFEIPLQLSPSYSFSMDDLPHLRVIFEEPYDDDPMFSTYVLFCEYWYRWGRLDNFIQILGCHPEFLEPFIKVHQCLFTGDLSLPYPVRYYLAILAAAELRCPQLVCLFVRYFLQAGGECTWLGSLSQAPSRWFQLKHLNHNLAHSPWKITADDIYQLTRGDEAVGRGEKLSLSELMHAVAIVTHVHALACFVFGAAVRPELEHTCPSPYQPCVYTTATTAAVADPASALPLVGPGDKTFILMNEQHYKDCQAKASDHLVKLLQSEPDEWDGHGDEEVVAEIFQSYAKSTAELNLAAVCEKVVASDSFTLEEHPVVTKFLPFPGSSFVDYFGPPFLLSEFSWMEEGCPLVDHLASSLGSLLDETFQNAFELTYNTLNEYTDVNTSSLRHTLWFFVQSVFGACHEDLRYEHVLKLLSLEQRCFLKVCATRPSDLIAYRPTTGRGIFAALSAPEVIHVMILIMEARKQACLSYALRAISQCQTRR